VFNLLHTKKKHLEYVLSIITTFLSLNCFHTKNFLIILDYEIWKKEILFYHIYRKFSMVV